MNLYCKNYQVYFWPFGLFVILPWICLLLLTDWFMWPTLAEVCRYCVATLSTSGWPGVEVILHSHCSWFSVCMAGYSFHCKWLQGYHRGSASFEGTMGVLVSWGPQFTRHHSWRIERYVLTSYTVYRALTKTVWLIVWGYSRSAVTLTQISAYSTHKNRAVHKIMEEMHMAYAKKKRASV